MWPWLFRLGNSADGWLVFTKRLLAVAVEFLPGGPGKGLIVVESESKSGIIGVVTLDSRSAECCQGDRSCLLLKYSVISVTESVMKLRHIRMALTTQIKKGR